MQGGCWVFSRTNERVRGYWLESTHLEVGPPHIDDKIIFSGLFRAYELSECFLCDARWLGDWKRHFCPPFWLIGGARRIHYVSVVAVRRQEWHLYTIIHLFP